MVKTWIKQLDIVNKNSKINFDEIILDLLNWEFKNYDIKLLSWYNYSYRLRIWTYRIIFENINSEIKILFIWKRWDIYKWLKNINLR